MGHLQPSEFDLLSISSCSVAGRKEIHTPLAVKAEWMECCLFVLSSVYTKTNHCKPAATLPNSCHLLKSLACNQGPAGRCLYRQHQTSTMYDAVSEQELFDATFAGAIFAALRLLAMSFITCLIAPTSMTSGASILLCFRMLRAACACLFGIVIRRPLAIQLAKFLTEIKMLHMNRA